MNKQFIGGMLLSATLGIVCIPYAMPYINALATRDINLGSLACKAEAVIMLHDGIPYGPAAPRCEGDFNNKIVTGFSFAPQSKVQGGEQLLCDFMQHNDWYFTWDRRGHEWHNEKTYSFENCKVGRQA